MTLLLRRKHRTTAKRRQRANASAGRRAILTLCAALIAASGFAQSAAAADSSATHLKWRSPSKDDPWQGVASAVRTAKRSDKIKWQPYRPYKSQPAAHVSLDATPKAEPIAAKVIAAKVVAAKPPTAAATRESIAKTTLTRTKPVEKTIRKKNVLRANNEQIEGPALKLVQFDDPFAPPKKDDTNKDDGFSAPEEAPKPEKKNDNDPFAPPMLEDSKPAELPMPKPEDSKPTDGELTPPEFGAPTEPADKPGPFSPPSKPVDSQPTDNDPFERPKPEDKEPAPLPMNKEPEPKPVDPKPEDKQPAETLPPMLDPDDSGAARPIKMTAGYAEVLQTVEDRLAKGSLRKIELDIAISGKPDQDMPASHPIADEEYEQRNWALTTYMWKASALCHKPLYFEQPHVERYGHAHHPLLEPILEGAHFFASVPLLPYKMGLQTPNECVYALGYYRPGSCAPYLLDPIPLSLRGALFQGAAIGAGVSLLP
jgi:hypothetical protein